MVHGVDNLHILQLGLCSMSHLLLHFAAGWLQVVRGVQYSEKVQCTCSLYNDYIIFVYYRH